MNYFNSQTYNMTSSTTASPTSPLYLLAGWQTTKSLTSSPTSSLSSSISSTWSSTSSTTGGASTTQSSLTCAFPSWPSRPCLSPTLPAQKTSGGSLQWEVPSSYISDFDLYPEDLDEDEIPYLEEAPAPPREYFPMAAPLAPLYASVRPKTKRRRSSKKGVKFTKPMSPIAESSSALE